MTRLAIVGITGRMGQALLDCMAVENELHLGAVTCRPNSEQVGQPLKQYSSISQSQLQIAASLKDVLDDFDMVIDFTNPDFSMKTLALCQATGKALVLGTTGLNEQQLALVLAASKQIPLVFAPNMSVGVNLLFKLLEISAAALSDEYDIEIIEAHHKHKVDAPSGTALRMGEVIASAQDSQLSDRAVYSREGLTGARPHGSIGFATIRAGDIVGEHTAMFASEAERIEICHKASSRKTFAKGALTAARWLQDKPVGLYDMQDVLALR